MHFESLEILGKTHVLKFNFILSFGRKKEMQ